MRGLGKKLPFSPGRPRFRAQNGDLAGVRAPGGRNTVESPHPPPKRAVFAWGADLNVKGKGGPVSPRAPRLSAIIKSRHYITVLTLGMKCGYAAILDRAMAGLAFEICAEVSNPLFAAHNHDGQMDNHFIRMG